MSKYHKLLAKFFRKCSITRDIGNTIYKRIDYFLIRLHVSVTYSWQKTQWVKIHFSSGLSTRKVIIISSQEVLCNKPCFYKIFGHYLLVKLSIPLFVSCHHVPDIPVIKFVSFLQSKFTADRDFFILQIARLRTPLFNPAHHAAYNLSQKVYF